MVGQIDSVPYLFLFLFLAHVQKMVYQSITYIIVPVPAHCTPTFYGIMDTMCVRVCVCLPQQHLCMSDRLVCVEVRMSVLLVTSTSRYWR